MTLILLLLLQTAAPPRTAQTNPAALTEVPKALKKDYDRFWARFLAGKDDSVLVKDLDKTLKKNPQFAPAIVIEAYIDWAHGRTSQAADKFQRVLEIDPNDRIALSYLADAAFDAQDYPKAADLYRRLLQADPSRADVDAKRQKSLILGTGNLLQQAEDEEQANRLSRAEALYRRALLLAPAEPSIYARLGALLAREQNWAEALSSFEKERQLAGPSEDVQRRIAETLAKLGRSDEARAILDGLNKPLARDGSTAPRDSQLEDLGRWGKEIERFREIRVSPQITREQLSLLIVRYFPQIADVRPAARVVVTDIQDSLARPEIQVVAGLGLIDPYPNHTFRPTTPVTRLDLATISARLAKVLDIPAKPPDAFPVFPRDLDAASSRYSDVQFVLSRRIMASDTGGNFNPGAPVAGDDAVAALKRLLDILQGKAR